MIEFKSVYAETEKKFFELLKENIYNGYSVVWETFSVDIGLSSYYVILQK